MIHVYRPRALDIFVQNSVYQSLSTVYRRPSNTYNKLRMHVQHIYISTCTYMWALTRRQNMTITLIFQFSDLCNHWENETNRKRMG